MTEQQSSRKCSFNNKDICIVGGAGFVGSNLVQELLAADAASITVVDNLLSSEQDNLPPDPRVTFIQGSVSDDSVLERLDDSFDYLFHLATFHGNQNSMADPLADHENNTLTTLKLCERVKDFKRLKKLVYSSAGCTVAEKTYDQAQATQEDAPVSLYLDSPYQMSKIIGEMYCNYYWTRHGLAVVKARFQNVYGPGEVLGAGVWRGTPATIWRNVTPTFIFKSLMGEALPVEAGGEATRDFIYVRDIAAGLMACALHGQDGGVYNLASGCETSILELAQTINKLTGNTTPLEIKPKRDWDHSGKRFGSTEKAARELGFRAQTELKQGLKNTIDWTRKNLQRIQACMKRHNSLMAQQNKGA